MKKSRKWQLVYAACCLVYMVWLINVSAFEFDRINKQYRRIAVQLDDNRIKSAALEDLTAECRRKSLRWPARDEGACASWPGPVVEAREQEIIEQVSRAKKRALVKLAMFYTVFVGFFLLAPPFLIYLIIVGIIKIYQDIKIVK